MEQSKSNIGAVFLAVIITAVFVGGGVHYFQKSATIETKGPTIEGTTELEADVVETIPAKQKSLVEDYETRYQYLDNTMMKDPDELGFNKLATVKVACPENPDGPCGFELLILSKDSLRSGQQEFYLAQAGGAGYSYYGPFTDDLERIVNESEKIEALK